MRKILLVEPNYKNKYPPLGLMKIATYHKLRGDLVEFTKGIDNTKFFTKWDRIYISTLFTFHWDITLKTITAYMNIVKSPEQIFVGGVLATLFSEELANKLGITVIAGLIDKPGVLDSDSSYIVDHLMPSYEILKQAKYDYKVDNAYIAYATRGCPNSCDFCAVRIIEPNFKHYVPLKRQINALEEVYGPRKDLLLLDNNVLASNKLDLIIKEIILLGFQRGAKFFGRKRYVDFNQGIDIRLINKQKMKLLSKIELFPLRYAFDNITLKKSYIEKVQLAKNYGFSRISTYVLYNYNDTPKDFYERIRTSVLLNEKINTKIYSFPMKYIPLNAKNRKFIGKNWCKRLIRGIQCILLATKGKVGPSKDFFEAAFGSNYDEFIETALMPDPFIIFRNQHKENGAKKWRKCFRKLDEEEINEFCSHFGYGKETLVKFRKSATPRLKKLIDIEVDARYKK